MQKIPPSICEIINSYFDKIYVVSLRRATDRQENIKKLFDGLNYEFFLAADKNDFSIEGVIENGIYDEVKALKYNRYGIKKLLAGEVACSWSHRNVYQQMVDRNIAKVLIFEDDAVPKIDDLAKLPNALAQLPPSWELFYLGFLQNEKILTKHWYKKQFYKTLAAFGCFGWLTPKEVDNLYPKPFSENLLKAGLHDCTHAYALTLTGAQKLVAAQTPIYSCADELLSHQILKGNIQAYISSPIFFDQEYYAEGRGNGGSYIWDIER